jgi:hypothetical protein
MTWRSRIHGQILHTTTRRYWRSERCVLIGDLCGCSHTSLWNISIIGHPTVAPCCFTNPSERFPWFSNMLFHNRFQLILKCFRLVNNRNIAGPGESAYDPWWMRLIRCNFWRNFGSLPGFSSYQFCFFSRSPEVTEPKAMITICVKCTGDREKCLWHSFGMSCKPDTFSNFKLKSKSR